MDSSRALNNIKEEIQLGTSIPRVRNNLSRSTEENCFRNSQKFCVILDENFWNNVRRLKVWITVIYVYMNK